MASSSLSSFVFFVLLIISLIGVMVESKQVMKVKPAAYGENIENVCSNSLDKEVCLNCINADHSRFTNDMRDLTHSILFCTWSQASFIHVDVDQLAQNTTDANLKEIYEFCNTTLYAAENQLFDSMTSFESYDYKKPRILMSMALKKVVACATKMEKDKPKGIQISPKLLDDMSLLYRLENVARIMMTFVKHPSTPPPG